LKSPPPNCPLYKGGKGDLEGENLPQPLFTKEGSSIYKRSIYDVIKGHRTKVPHYMGFDD